MSEVDAGAVHVLPDWAELYPAEQQRDATIADEKRLVCVRGGRATSILHHCTSPKVWSPSGQSRLLWGELYVRLLPRVLFGDDVLLRLAFEDVPWWLRPTGLALWKGYGYEGLVSRVKALSGEVLPTDASVLVISGGDDDLLKLPVRRACHFPQDENGVYAGKPAQSDDAIAHLEDLCRRGFDFMLVPRTSWWWFDHYTDFRDHLTRHYRAHLYVEACCVIYSLHEAPMDTPMLRVPLTDA